MPEINPCDLFAKCESFSQPSGSLPQNAKAIARVRGTLCKQQKPQLVSGEPSAKCGSPKTVKVDKCKVRYAQYCLI